MLSNEDEIKNRFFKCLETNRFIAEKGIKRVLVASIKRLVIFESNIIA